MKKKIDYRIILLLISISIILVAILGGELTNNTIISSIFDVVLYLLLSGCIIFVENIISNNKRGVYLSIKENIVLIIASVSYMLIKTALMIIVKIPYIDSYAVIVILIVFRYILLSVYINYLLLINQDNHSIKQILLNELFITLIFAVLLLLLSITINITNVSLKNALNALIISAIIVLSYIIKHDK